MKRTPARKPDAVCVNDRLAAWAAREKDGGTIAALVKHNMAGGGHTDPVTGSGDDLWDGERDTVVESDLGALHDLSPAKSLELEGKRATNDGGRAASGSTR